MPHNEQIPVIDIFAGPGGLGEGFSSFGGKHPKFKIGLSVEMEKNAHQTLELRAFYRQFPKGQAPAEYYSLLRGEINRSMLFEIYPAEASNAQREALHATLGSEEDKGTIDSRISNALNGALSWVLIGGPPCQAYSLVGRSRNKGNSSYKAEKDNRHFLYTEYLRIIADYHPPIFVMENVKGILSSKVNGELIFERIRNDLKAPYKVISQSDSRNCYHYNLYSLVRDGSENSFGNHSLDAKDYVIQSENHGIPQARHRVILMGVREDFNDISDHGLEKAESENVWNVIEDLPRVRSGLSNGDSPEAWKSTIRKALDSLWLKDVDPDIRKCINTTVGKVRLPHEKRGAEFIASSNKVRTLKKWFHDFRLKGVCNHTTRGHIPDDLHRYLFAACFAKVRGRSPILSDFPKSLLPDHKNVTDAINEGSLFSDRFRVQLADCPSTTITSHISKDGHYYIHYDPTQCRSLTVREAARLQTFPDNYFFCGPRTAQYHQVGNAVPPYLAYQIAEVVWNILKKKS